MLGGLGWIGSLGQLNNITGLFWYKYNTIILASHTMEYNPDGIIVAISIEDELKQVKTMLTNVLEESILLKKQLRMVRKERDIYKQYVPQALLTMQNIKRDLPCIEERRISPGILYK